MFFKSGDKKKADTPATEDFDAQRRALVEKAQQFVNGSQTKIDALLAQLEPLDTAAISSFGQSTIDALNDAAEKVMQGIPANGSSAPQPVLPQTGREVAAAFNNGAVRNALQAPRPARFTNAMRMM